MARNTKPHKYVYFFGANKADGNESMKNLLGGKGAKLAGMAGHPNQAQVKGALTKIEKITGKIFGDEKNPLLLSVRSGARKSMPGMMETVLNIGLNEKTIEGLIAHGGEPRFAYDAYRRLIMMYADVVMEKASGIEISGKGIRKMLDEQLESIKKQRGYSSDTELTALELKSLIEEYKKTIIKVLGKPFPEDPFQQLWGSIGAVFSSWNGKRAIEYRRIEKIPNEWGTAVNVHLKS